MNLKLANRVVVGDRVCLSDDTTRKRTIECQVTVVRQERRARGRLYVVLELVDPQGRHVGSRAWPPYAAVRMA